MLPAQSKRLEGRPRDVARQGVAHSATRQVCKGGPDSLYPSRIELLLIDVKSIILGKVRRTTLFVSCPCGGPPQLPV